MPGATLSNPIGRKRQKPRYSLFWTGWSLFCAPLLTIVSAPVWLLIITSHLFHDKSGPSNSPDPGQFDGPIIISLIILTGVAGAVLGAIFAIVAHVRRESEWLVRVVTFAANVAVVPGSSPILCGDDSSDPGRVCNPGVFIDFHQMMS